MKIFYRQLILSLLFIGVIFGFAAYFAVQSLHTLAEQSAQALAAHFHEVIIANRNEKQFYHTLKQAASSFKTVENLFLINKENKVVFSLKENALVPSIDFNKAAKNPKEIRPTKMRAVGEYTCVWLVEPNLYGVLHIKGEAGGLRAVLYDFNLKLYLIGLGGVLGAILLALVGSRVSRAPLHQITRAMDTIAKRRYSFRLSWKPKDDFAALYKKVNSALERMEELDQAQRRAAGERERALKKLRDQARLLDLMAHEIKNPLHSLGINLDVLKTKIDKGLPKESALKQVETLEGQLAHLQEVVEGFFGYVRPGIPKKERTSVNEIIKSVCQMASADAEKSKIQIETRLGKKLRDVVVDRNQVQQALHNIVINAIHATGQGGKIAIRSWEKRNKVLISVKDTGEGVSKEQMKKIFELYYTTKKNGTGLGLPVSKRIVETNKGELFMESGVGKGTTVTFMFPAM